MIPVGICFMMKEEKEETAVSSFFCYDGLVVHSFAGRVWVCCEEPAGRENICSGRSYYGRG